MVKADVSCTTDDTDEENSEAQHNTHVSQSQATDEGLENLCSKNNALLPPQDLLLHVDCVDAGLSAPVTHQKQDLLADFTLDGALKRPANAGWSKVGTVSPFRMLPLALQL